MKNLQYLLLLFLWGCNQSSADVSSLQVIDTHNDILHNQYRLDHPRHFEFPGWEPYNGKDFNFNLSGAKKGQMIGQVFSIFVNSNEPNDQYFNLAVQQIDTLKKWTQRNKDSVRWVSKPNELLEARKEDQFAVLFGVEGGHVIEDSMDKLELLTKRGMVYLTITWNNSTSWATSAADEQKNGFNSNLNGLSPKGVEIIRWMNEKGVLIDVSHLGEQSFWDIMKITEKPIIASHSCSHTLTPNRRNLKDDQLDAIAKNNGVVFVNFYSGFVDSTYNGRYKKYLSKYESEIDSLGGKYSNDWYGEIEHFASHPEEMNALRPPLSDLVDHIVYIKNRIGIDHVGIGADFEGAESFPMNINGIKDYPALAKALIQKGFTDEDLAKLGWKNFFRVWNAQFD